jgi:hypothetical protein
MKTLATVTSIAAIATLASASAFAATPAKYDVKVLDLNNAALVQVTQDGQPVDGAKVTLEGLTASTFQTSEGGTVTLTNNSNASRSYTISVEQPDGSVTSTQRFLSVTQ